MFHLLGHYIYAFGIKSKKQTHYLRIIFYFLQKRIKKSKYSINARKPDESARTGKA